MLVSTLLSRLLTLLAASDKANKICITLSKEELKRYGH